MNTASVTPTRSTVPQRTSAGTHPGRLLVVLLLCCAAVVLGPIGGAAADTVVVGGPGQRPQPGIVKLTGTGHPGERQLVPAQYCWKLSGASGIQSATFFAFRSPAYEAYTQTISMHVRLDYLGSDNRTWIPLSWAPSQSFVARSGQYPRFQVRSFPVTPGYVYRVVHVFTWSVNGTVVGQTYDTVNGDAIATNSLDGSVVRNVGTAPGWCAFFR
jgi:hypothetical protein